MSAFEVLNDPRHVCELPDPTPYARGTHVQCMADVVGGAWRGKCGKKYTRRSTFMGVPVWRDFDWGM